MQLHRLKIDCFRNLRAFEITFAATADVDGESRRLRSHAVIGQNGSGKSNMLEAIVTIFRDLDLNNLTPFGYELVYEVRGFHIHVVAEANCEPQITINGEPAEPWLLSDTFRESPETGEAERGSARKYLPSHIFTYYSGKSERLESLFQEHQQRYIEDLNDFSDAVDPYSLLRRLFYCRHPHSKLVLLACLLAPEKPLKDILHDLRIEDVDSVLFTLKKPYRLSGRLSETNIKRGDNRFWFDRTRFTEEFLGKLWDLATAPIDHTDEKTIDFRGRTEPQEVLYLFLKDREALQELKDHIGDSYRFFQYVEGSYIADLLDDVQIFVQHKNADDLLSFEQLSEGELQLLTVLGLMRITHQDQCLFLLDEPDTHLNPIWKLRYFDEIEKVLKQDEDEIIQGDSQIIITTHDPMMIGSLKKEQVRVLRTHDGKTVAAEPDEDPQGMGVAGLLKSEFFGLRSTVDTETLRRLDRRNFLYAQGEERSSDEDAELSRLSGELSDLGFASDFRDPYFELFVKRMAKHTKFQKETLSAEERDEQDAIADQIIDKILAEEDVE
ncbi:MAG: AAA family ATPase [Rhodopirellula sp.]|nr:AAA family ATPase [Rhodopirellula sp.]